MLILTTAVADFRGRVVGGYFPASFIAVYRVYCSDAYCFTCYRLRMRLGMTMVGLRISRARLVRHSPLLRTRRLMFALRISWLLTVSFPLYLAAHDIRLVFLDSELI
jgi:hypothetical protein